MKIKICFIMLLFGMTIFMLPLSFHATTEEDLIKFINEKVHFLEGYCAYSESLYTRDRAPEKIDLLEHQLSGGETYIEPFYLAREEFQDYEGFKKMLLTYATPFLAMEFYSYNGPFLNLNGQLYVRELLGGYAESGFRVDTIEIIEQKDNYLTVSASRHFNNGDIWFEDTVGLGKYNDSWRIDYIEQTIGLEPSLRNEENVEKVFKDYICNVIRGYLLSDNINCGYKKYSQKAEYLHSLDIVLTEYDLDTCKSSGYAIVDEYDKNGNVVRQNKITVDIGRNLTETVTEKEYLLDLVYEMANFLEDYCGCAGFTLLNNDSYAQKLELLEHPDWDKIFIESIHPAIEKVQDYENYKQLILSHATPFLTMQLFSVYDKFFNINGRLYLQDTGAPYGEGGINFDTIDIIEEKDDYLTVLAIYHFFDDLIFETPIGLEKHNDSWRIDYIKNTTGLEPSLINEDYIEKVFRDYICNVIRGYLLSDNVNCGYKKYSQNARYLISLKIDLTEYDLDTCTGSGYAIVEEYDKAGNVVGEHKITVEIGENLSDTVTDEVLWYDNPQSSDSDWGLYVSLTVISLSAVYLLMRKQKIK